MTRCEVMMKEHAAARLFPLLGKSELQPLVESVRRGFDAAHPVLMYRGEVLDGRNRMRACEIAGVDPVVVELPDDCDPWLEAWKHNGARRDLDPDQKAAIYLQLMAESKAWQQQREQRQREANEARAKAAKKQPRKEGGVFDTTGAPSREGRPVASSATAKALAEQAGVSRATVERVQKLQREAPDAFEAVARGEAKANKELGKLKIKHKQQLAADLDAAPVPHPTERFNVIVIDPPWRYGKRAEDVTHRGRNQYPDMDVADIGRLPVVDRAETDCVLWLWTTNAFMHDAYHCVDAWGFTPKTILTWAKDRMGVGDWLRGQTEHCIMAVRGKPLVTLSNQTTLLHGPMREHSRKPDEFFELVESLCHGTKLEMFAREPRPGWQVWGAETGAFEAC